MPIDWFTVGAQAINFLVLVWLMKRFLYRPVLDAIDAREQRIAAQLAQADARHAEATRERDEFQKKNEEFERQRAALLRQATEEARVERQRLMEESRQAADELRARREDALNREQKKLQSEITRRTQEEVFAIARKTLNDLAGASLEERMSEAFVRQVRTLSADAREDLVHALKNASTPLLVRSRFNLSPEQQTAISKTIHESLATGLQIRFETAADVISGIELTVNGRKVAWSVADYLESLEKSLEELVQNRTHSAAGGGLRGNPSQSAAVQLPGSGKSTP